MACYHPVEAWYSAQKTPRGKRKLVFSASGGVGLPIKVPCIQCIGCRIETARQWAVRCVHETQLHDESGFVTLTYAPEHLPENGSLSKRDHQLFLKRLRRHLGRAKRIRYFLCGEYGEKLARPHYHLILWGHRFPDQTFYKTTPAGPLWESATLDRIWGLGHCTIGEVTFESAQYVAQYQLKKITGDLAKKHYERINPDTGEVVQLEPEASYMSRRPGIGAGWFNKFATDLYPDDFVVQKGKKLRVPRYYDSKLSEAQLQELKLRRKKDAAIYRRHNTPARLRVREEVKIASRQQNKRDHFK